MSDKFENLLNLALETPLQERVQTQSLNVGFEEQTRSWEMIVKYHGMLDDLRAAGIGVEELIAGYAILNVPETLVDLVARTDQIEYVEKPKRYYYGQLAPGVESCVRQVTDREPFLVGEGVLIAVLDSGIDYSRSDFRREDGSTRIKYLYDQNLDREFGEEEINEALAAPTLRERVTLVPSFDSSGHGTAVAGIAAGYDPQKDYRGIAPGADLIIVKLGAVEDTGFPRTTQIMRGVTYALRKAGELGRPLVINLSFGNSYGPHDGSSLLERFLDNAAEIGRTVICVGSGNEGSSAGHYAGSFPEGSFAAQNVELAVAQFERSLSVQLWKNYGDRYRIILKSPAGEELTLVEGGVEEASGKFVLFAGRTRILLFVGEPLPYSVAQEIYLELIPQSGNYIDSGIWTFRIEPVRIVTGEYYFYLQNGGTRNSRTGFFLPTSEVTMTVPGTAAKVITVGAYDPIYDAYADFSGRGYVDPGRTIGVMTAGLVKPDLVAPGVDIAAPDLFGGYTAVTGTSFATPIVSGSAALLMEWGIVRGNDPYLYGEKVKAYLRKGARPLRGERKVPNDRVGFGALCVDDSLP